VHGAGARVAVKERLIELLRRHSYRYDPESGFRLTSGKLSAFYVDCKATTMRGDAADVVGALVADRLPSGVTAVGGLTMGADPIALATAAYATGHGRPLDAFSVRKEPKKHGLARWIEGAVAPNATVGVVDDVVTTGGSTIEAIRRCREAGLTVAAVVVLVDRQEEDGLATIEREAGPRVPVSAIVALAELRTDADPRSGSSVAR
jgi:orotate phosphoribosyltransferase